MQFFRGVAQSIVTILCATPLKNCTLIYKSSLAYLSFSSVSGQVVVAVGFFT